jgi:ammonia channel protein AmtB
LWGLIVYSMIFGEGIPSGVIGGTTFATINKLAMGGNLSFVYYSFMFAMTALAIIIGGSGLGMKTLPFQLFMAATLLLNYAP